MIALTLSSPDALLRIGVKGPINIDVVPTIGAGTEFRVVVPIDQRDLLETRHQSETLETLARMINGLMNARLPQLFEEQPGNTADSRGTFRVTACEARNAPADFYEGALIWGHIPPKEANEDDSADAEPFKFCGESAQ
jgi:hypothetical protein